MEVREWRRKLQARLQFGLRAEAFPTWYHLEADMRPWLPTVAGLCLVFRMSIPRNGFMEARKQIFSTKHFTVDGEFSNEVNKEASNVQFHLLKLTWDMDKTCLDWTSPPSSVTYVVQYVSLWNSTAGIYGRTYSHNSSLITAVFPRHSCTDMWKKHKMMLNFHSASSIWKASAGVVLHLSPWAALITGAQVAMLVVDIHS